MRDEHSCNLFLRFNNVNDININVRSLSSSVIIACPAQPIEIAAGSVHPLSVLICRACIYSIPSLVIVSLVELYPPSYDSEHKVLSLEALA